MTLEQLENKLKAFQEAAAAHRKNADANDWAAQGVVQLIEEEKKNLLGVAEALTDENVATVMSSEDVKNALSIARKAAGLDTPKRRGRPPGSGKNKNK